MPGITQIRLSGFGGQGVVLAGLLLGEAGVAEGKYVAGSNSYGAQARGSGCKSEVVFSDAPIDFPHLTTADILVAMSQGTYDQYCADINPETGLILYDQSQVTPPGGPESQTGRSSCNRVRSEEIKEQTGGQYHPSRRTR